MTKNKSKWFTKVRQSYLPKSAPGYAIHILYTLYLVALFIVWYRAGHGAWELVVYVIPLGVAAAVLTQYIASKHS
ncbi:MAG: hypothetical protein U0451_02275 [Candidatus Saccharimonadales bacterium]